MNNLDYNHGHPHNLLIQLDDLFSLHLQASQRRIINNRLSQLLIIHNFQWPNNLSTFTDLATFQHTNIYIYSKSLPDLQSHIGIRHPFIFQAIKDVDHNTYMINLDTKDNWSKVIGS